MFSAKKLDEKIAIKIFKLFYNFLNEFFFPTEFLKNSINFIKYKDKSKQTKNNKIIIKTTDFSTIILNYYKYTTYKLDKIVRVRQNMAL